MIPNNKSVLDLCCFEGPCIVFLRLNTFLLLRECVVVLGELLMGPKCAVRRFFLHLLGLLYVGFVGVDGRSEVAESSAEIEAWLGVLWRDWITADSWWKHRAQT